MKTWIVRTALLSAGLLVVSMYGIAADDKTPDIETVMKKVNGGKGLHKSVAADLKARTIDWAAVAKKTKEYSELASALGKNEPPKGEKKSWDKLTKEYADNAKALNTAAEKKDKSATAAAHAKFMRMCKPCHDTHK